MGPSNCSHCLQCFSVFGIPSIFYSQEHIEGSFYIYLFLLHCCIVKLWKLFNKKLDRLLGQSRAPDLYSNMHKLITSSNNSRKHRKNFQKEHTFPTN